MHDSQCKTKKYWENVYNKSRLTLSTRLGRKAGPKASLRASSCSSAARFLYSSGGHFWSPRILLPPEISNRKNINKSYGFKFADKVGYKILEYTYLIFTQKRRQKGIEIIEKNLFSQLLIPRFSRQKLSRIKVLISKNCNEMDFLIQRMIASLFTW